jgi:hypothetical protein
LQVVFTPLYESDRFKLVIQVADAPSILGAPFFGIPFQSKRLVMVHQSFAIVIKEFCLGKWRSPN